jgi:hypothetical protein
MDYLESRTVKTEIDNANNLALYGLNALNSAKGMKAPNTKEPRLVSVFFVFRFRRFATRRVIQRSWGFETQTVCVSPAEQSQVLRGISRLPIRHEGPLVEWPFCIQVFSWASPSTVC